MLVFSVFLVIVLVCIVLLDDRPTPIRITKWQKRLGEKSSKWIVVTTVQEPTKDIKVGAGNTCKQYGSRNLFDRFYAQRLSRIPGWTLVVVGDTKTPKNWSLEGVHYLSVEHQQRCGELTLDFHEHILFEVDNAGYQILDYLPYKSYARKNIGYLYAIQNGAEWIYDTDDDNKPYGIINLEIILSQYRHEKSFWDPDWSSLTFLRRPVDFAMVANFKKNVKLNTTRGFRRRSFSILIRSSAMLTCGLEDFPWSTYRLLHADKREGLDKGFNKFAPPITLASGTYAPWNSQNTLFHRRAFFTLLLPVTVTFRVTDIWRSYFAQKLLHLVGENIAFYPANAIQIRNSHNYLDDFRSEENIYLKAGEMVKFLDGWRCAHTLIANCAIELAEEFRARNFWEKADAILVRKWIEDLLDMSYKFPSIKSVNEFSMSPNESLRGSNCRRAEMEFVSDRSRPNEADERSKFKIRAFGELSDWCEAANYSEFLHKLPSPRQLTVAHNKDDVLTDLENTVGILSSNFVYFVQALIITYNYPMNQTIGVLQRMYQPYFGVTIFCGPWYPEKYDDYSDFPRVLRPFSYIHISKKEMQNGYYAYYCMSKVKDLRLGNLQGNTALLLKQHLWLLKQYIFIFRLLRNGRRQHI
ncbi:hypothetical protein Y032_0101g3339 [Ancylostoma ceylanicum]|nr:hypothetical protein Y032_0101g3339 [Ancylostoma ceylanicum]